MEKINRREFLKDAISLIAFRTIIGSTPFILNPILTSKNKYNSDLEEILVTNSNEQYGQITPINQTNLPDMTIETENYIEELRKYAKNTPSRERILEHYQKLKENNILNEIKESSERFGIIGDFISPILCIEQGSPYKGANFGLAVESPTGCRGIAQLSFDAFFDVIKWYNEQKKNEKYLNSPLEAFLKNYKKGMNEGFSQRDKILEEIILENPIYEQSKISDEVAKNVHNISEKKAKEYLKEDFNKIFLNPTVKLNDKTYSSTALQIEIMSAYLKILYNPLQNWDFTIGAYNHGLGTTRALISKYEGKHIPIHYLSEIIENKKLDYRKLYDKKGINLFLKEYKENTGLTYLDKEYYTKVLIALYELNLNKS